MAVQFSSSQLEDRPRTSAPVSEVQASGRDESLTSLEATLQVATTSRTPLTEILPVHTPDGEESASTCQQQGNETTSPLYDAPHCLEEPVK